MGLFDGTLKAYRATLKPLSVEEPIDVVWHRLSGYAIARAAEPTPISADALTVMAIAVGVTAGGLIAASFPGHLLAAAGLLELSAAFDCADGQLARMRKRSSAFGRMLDGVSDSLVMAATFLGTMLHFLLTRAPAWTLVLALIAAPTCSFHFGWYDHYKNVYLRMTEPTFREGEDPEVARARHDSARARSGWLMRFVWWVYLHYVTGQAWLLRWSDPQSAVRLDALGGFDERRKEIWARHALGPMRVWRSFYGLGTHIFLFSVACAFDRIDLYLLFRVGLLNLFAFLVLLPWQGRRSQAAFREMAQAGEVAG